jgi:transcriptional regulator with XRE-family HTH domain
MIRLRVEEVRKAKKISMGKLSRLSDVSFTTVRRVCNDPSYSPTLNTLERIARALSVHVSDLYEELPDE